MESLPETREVEEVFSLYESQLEKKFNELRLQRMEKESKKELANSLRLTIADIEYALRRHGGNLLQTAKFLGIDRSLLKRKVDLSPSLKRLQENLREEALDKAEAKLMEHVEDGYFPAISLLLKTQGKERGYSERITAEYELGENATRTAAALIEAMRRGLEAETPAIEVKDYHVEDEGS